MSVRSGASVSGGGDAAGGAGRAGGDGGEGGEGGDDLDLEAISLLRLLDCMRRAQRLPVVLLPSSLLSLELTRRALPSLRGAPGDGAAGGGAAAALLALAVRWEGAVLRRADVVLAPSPHDAALLAAAAPGSHVLVRPPLGAVQVQPPTAAAPRPLARRRGALVVADADAGGGGLLWLLQEVWPRLAAPPQLRLLGRGWRELLARDGARDGDLRGDEGALARRLRALRSAGGAAPSRRRPLRLLGAAAADSEAARRALDGAAVLLLPRQRNETGGAAPSWGAPSAAASALCRGLPLVGTPAARLLPRSVAPECALLPTAADAAAFAADVEALTGGAAAWSRRSALGRDCALAHLGPAAVERGWESHLAHVLAAVEVDE